MEGTLDIQFREGLTTEQRNVAEASVRAMLARHTAEGAAASLRRQQKDEFRQRVVDRLGKLILEDPAVAATLTAATQSRLRSEALSLDGVPVQMESRLALPPAGPTPFTLAIPIEPPFDYTWQYRLPNSGPPHQSIADVDGNLILNAMSDHIVGGVDTFVNVHCGVGCSFKLSHTASVKLNADMDFRYKFLVDCTGIGGYASVDGGVDAALMRGSEAIMIATAPVYHRRISGYEDAQMDVPFAPLHYPNGIASQVEPGTYAFNLGIWAVSDYGNGVGQSAAQSSCQARVRKMLIVAV
ncbi:hypothetical protein [Aestuariivirga sp.]|uniref:hypothetical protein n=1 Tax=Aestuariivirga sp. TaxID=2650926 RepID=UPI0039E5A12F